MRFYLRIINPAIALIILVLCFWAATYSDGDFEIGGLVYGGMSTYFFAKGLFSASAVFLLGRVLLQIIDKNDTGNTNAISPKEYSYLFVHFGLILSIFVAIFILFAQEKEERSGTFVMDPPALKVLDSYRIDKSELVRIGGRVQNGSDEMMEKVSVLAELYVEGNYAGQSSVYVGNIPADSIARFVIECRGMVNDVIGTDLTYKLATEAEVE